MLSAADNQIVSLSARSPYNILSGCTITKKTPSTPLATQSTTERPDDTTPQYGYDEMPSTENVFDKFLKRTTDAPSSTVDQTSTSFDDNTNVTDTVGMSDFLEAFNDTEVFNVTSNSAGRNGGGLSFKHDTAFENNLENSTEFRSDVEELFETQVESHHMADMEEMDEVDRPRSERLLDGNLFHRTRETYTVKCHNAGTFLSSRERW